MSEFWAKKVRTYFSKLDLNSDGFISKSDVEDMADKFADAQNATPEQREECKTNFVERNDPEFKETFDRAARILFTVRDANSDGYLSEEEYARAFAGVGVKDTSFVHNAFEYMDLNNLKLDLAEYSSGLFKYLTTEDEHLLWGPLVD